MMDKMNDANHPERIKNYTDWAKFSIYEVTSSDEVKGVDRITSMIAFLVMEFAAYLDMNTPATTATSLEEMLDELFGTGKGDK